MWGCKLNRVLSIIVFSSMPSQCTLHQKLCPSIVNTSPKCRNLATSQFCSSLLHRYLGHSAKNSYLNVHSSFTPEHTTTWEGLSSFLYTHRSQGSATAINLFMLFNNEPSVLKRLCILSLFSSF